MHWQTDREKMTAKCQCYECTIPPDGIPANHSAQSKPVSMPQVPPDALRMVLSNGTQEANLVQMGYNWPMSSACMTGKNRIRRFCLHD